MVTNILGQLQVKVSPKGRIAFPKKFRESLGEKIIITRGYEGCLIAISEKEWATISGETENKSFIFGPTRDTTRFLLGNASFIELDDQGRFVVPAHLREYSEIDKEAVFLGLNKYVEIWSKEKWEEYQKYLNKNISQISERLTQINDRQS